MGLTPWERYRDTLLWRKHAAERDLAVLMDIPAFILETREAKERGIHTRHRELVAKIQEKIDQYTVKLAAWEQKRPG